MKEFEYKPAEFYTSYFEKHPDFKVIEQFCSSAEKDEKNLYVGKIEILNTIHPLELRVEIPKTFPHHKLVFRTKSISGYPHLIHTGKIQYGDWFCLNTPFAETAEEQLNQEILRLKEWIYRQMKEELPAVIDDEDVIEALRLTSTPEWMNPDEIKEVKVKAQLTFIGKFAENTANFMESIGSFHCLQTPDKRFYAFKEKYLFTSYKLPFIIVDAPKDFAILKDFVTLRDYYKWDETTCEHLLPGYKVSKPLHVWHSFSPWGGQGINLDEETALKKIEQIREILAQDEPYLNPTIKSQAFADLFPNDGVRQRVLPVHRDLILKELDIIEKKVRNDHGIKTRPGIDNIPEDEMTDEDWATQAEIDAWIERGSYVFNYFVLGIKDGSDIFWILSYTNHNARKFNQKTYNVEVGEVDIEKSTSLALNTSVAQTIDESMFFGRGALCRNIIAKKVALIGLGAIGSMVAESLAHAGVNKIGLWDSDVVEPGNICRSAYQLQDIGESKVQAVVKKLRAINPFIEAKDIKSSGKWVEYMGPNFLNYQDGSFYDNINYTNQADAIEKIKDYDLIIDCTGSNEILHFLSYALPDKEVISMCITNQAKELVCVSNKNGNPFEMRKTYLSAIEQDTKNFYVEGSGCYEPTFKATYFDICSLVNLCIRELNSNMQNGSLINSTIFKYTDRGIVTNRVYTYRLQDSDIILNIPNEVLLDAEDLPESFPDYLGFIFGSYSKDGKQIMVTHIVEPEHAKTLLEDVFTISKEIIDYLGDVAYSGSERETILKESFEDIAAKAMDQEINTNNPLLAIRNPEGDFSFFLYIDNELVPFKRIND